MHSTMASGAPSTTVAEQVAALPPLPWLLGMEGAESESERNPSRKTRLKPNTTAPRSMTAGRRAVGAKDRAQAPLPPVEGEAVSGAEAAASTARVQPTPPSAQLPGTHLGGLGEWRRVQATLQLPLAYRGEEEIQRSVQLMRSLPFFSPLLDHDLLTLTEAMTLVDIAEAGTVVLRKTSSPLLVSAETTKGVKTAQQQQQQPSTGGLVGDEDDEGGAGRPKWMVPASELFQRFQAQMANGSPPSLPAVCVEQHSRRHADGGRSPAAGQQRAGLRKEKASRAASGAPRRSTAVSTAAAPSDAGEDPVDADAAKPALFEVPEGWADGAEIGDQDAEEPFVLVLLSGHCELRWPRKQGPADDASAARHHAYALQPGDAMGYALVWAALPEGAYYVTSDRCTVLKVCADGQSRDISERLHRACHRANEAVYKAQRAFLAEQLQVPLFASDHKDGPRRRRTVDASDAAAAAGASESKAATPSLLLERAARELIPVRVPAETVLIREGLSPASECAVYFVAEGGCAVVRRLWWPDQQRLETRRTHLVKELTGVSGVRPTLSAMPSTTSMEVAQLRPGDYCGDLGYLRIDPDHATSIDAEWTAAYWRQTFLSHREAEPAAEEGEAVSPLELSLRARRQRLPSAGTTTGDNAESKSVYCRHKATVITQRSSQLYVLLPSAAAECIQGTVLDRMVEHANAYKGYATVLAEYEKMYKWAVYKEKVLWDESRKAPMPLR